MKQHCFGDINDYRKYGLLRVLNGSGVLPACVCWMLTPDKACDRDGARHTYLAHPEVWRHFDPELFDYLQTELQQREAFRGIDELNLGRILPGVSFCTSLLYDTVEERADYFDSLVRTLPSSGGLLLFDPDNGLETASCRKGKKGSAKYLYWDEIRKAYEAGYSVLICQQFQRGERKQFIRTISEKAKAETGATVFAYVTSHVVFFLLSREEHLVHFQDANIRLSRLWYPQIFISSAEALQQQGAKLACAFCTPDNAKIILSNAHAVAIVDRNPVTPGHSLVIPKRHIASLFDATREEQAALLDLLTEMRLLLLKEHSPDGFNIGINDGVVAGQTISHLHIHLIPRYAGDAADRRGGVRWSSP